MGSVLALLIIAVGVFFILKAAKLGFKILGFIIVLCVVLKYTNIYQSLVALF